MKLKSRITIRNWTEKDFSCVKDILLTTWKSTYTFLPESDILIHLNKFYSDEKLKELFVNPYIFGLVIEVESQPAGWMKLYENKSENRFYISSLYILPEFQMMGLGKQFLLKAIEIALNKNYGKIWLGVMKENLNALNWYEKHEFNFIEEEPFQMGSTSVSHLIGYKIIR